MTFDSGYLLDPRDDRDLIFNPTLEAGSFASVGAGAVILPVTSPISNQWRAPTCVSNAVCDAFELLAGRPDGVVTVDSLAAARASLRDDIADPIQLSRLFVNFFSKLSHGAECDASEGTFPRAALSAAARIGICREDLWPYDDDPNKTIMRPTLEAISEAYDHRIDKYRSIPRGNAKDMGLRVRAAIREGLPVIHGKVVDKRYLQAYDVADSKTVIPAPTNIEGRHATLIVGYWQRPDGSYVYLDRNSHSERYGLLELPGHIWITEEYLSLAVDLWVPTLPWQPATV